MAEEFVTVATFATLPEAEAARLRLETEGFPAVITDAEIVNMDWLLGNAVGYIKIQVPPRRAEAASALLERIHAERRERRAAAEENESWESPDDALCLACGTEIPEEADRCPGCGWSYADGQEM